MTLLITGGAGYIGSHVVRQLTEAGHKVVVFDNLSTGFADALIHGEELIVGDLADVQKLESVFSKHRFSCVLHFAASIIVPESIGNPLKYYENNTRNTLNLLGACVRFNIEQFVFSSTAAVYGIPASGVASEDSPAVPINPYGTSKLMSEWLLRDVGIAHGLRSVVLRYFNVAGADPQSRMGQRTPESTHLIKVCCQAALGKRASVSIFGSDYPTPDGTGVRDYIHIEDLAAAHLGALSHLQQGGKNLTLNVGYGHGSSVREVIETASRVAGGMIPTQEAPRRPGDPPILIAKADRVRAVLKWQPQYDNLKKIITDAFRWEQKLTELT